MGNKLGFNWSQGVEPSRRNRRRLTGVPSRRLMKKEGRKKCNNPPSAYALFIRDVRNQLFDRKVGFRELTQSCARKWKEMSAQEKQRYHQMAKEIRENMLRICGRSQRRTRKDSKTRKKTNYWNYAQLIRRRVYDEMKERDGRKPRMKDVNREVGNQWRQLSAEQKNSFKL